MQVSHIVTYITPRACVACDQNTNFPHHKHKLGHGECVLMQVGEVGLAGDILPVPPSHKAVRRRLIYTAEHRLVELPSSLAWLFSAKPPFSRPLLPALLAEIFRWVLSLTALFLQIDSTGGAPVIKK